MISLEVAGTSYRKKALQHKSFSPGNRLLLIPEPENVYDENAIGVWSSNKSLHIGYIPMSDSKRISDKFKEGQRWHAVSMWQTVKNGKRVGLRILIYREGTKLLA